MLDQGGFQEALKGIRAPADHPHTKETLHCIQKGYELGSEFKLDHTSKAIMHTPATSQWHPRKLPNPSTGTVSSTPAQLLRQKKQTNWGRTPRYCTCLRQIRPEFNNAEVNGLSGSLIKQIPGRWLWLCAKHCKRASRIVRAWMHRANEQGG